MTNTPKASVPLLQLALSLEPKSIPALNALGLAFHASHDYAEACRCFEQALGIVPGRVELLRNLAHAQFGRKDWAKAQAVFAQLHVRGEKIQKDWIPHALSLHHLKRNKEAVAVLEQFLAQDPNNAEAWYALGLCVYDVQGASAAIHAYRQCITHNPKKYTAYLNLVAIAHKHSNAQMAANVARDLLKINKNYLPIYGNYGLALASLGKGREAVEAFERLIAGQPANYRCRSNLLFYSQYLEDTTARKLYELHHEWDVRHAEPLRRSWPKHRNDPSPGRRLRIGYVSPDLKFHSCAWFMMDLLAHHDRSAFEIYAYANLERADKVTDQLKANVDVWRDVDTLTETELARQIHQDRIDILIDLAGHTGRNSLITFACKPAPVQATWLGYPGTTGLRAIDYRISDPWLTPDDTPEIFSEQVYNLPRVSHCFRAPEAAEPNALPARAKSFVTFGSFNNFAKVSDTAARLWTAALNRVPTARLLLKSRYIGSAESREAILDRFRRAGADLSRIDFANGNERQDDHLNQYGQIDIALDSFPYGGMTTTCEALWMGVPVVTMLGDRTCARYGNSVLNAVGLGELVATDPEQFGEIAARLAGDLDQLAELRATLRDRMARSPLCDGPGFTRAMEAAYRDMWNRWCQTQSR
ncbi:tetratricopeptide repeat protein [Azospirillum soli]|uniref:O-linked N-acetylglucosamine transferase, SPINDLY family protein n=1 Tax=Azospirillum soli TaxID=1304799 RepID=UPI001AE1C46A|nr:tetratricopeptide repeat protein [Azospirillum soli]MBP2316539.1 putative O-linked N-acetylglucosamine transferase (SPINDLY family) [Azospirillum soli]